MGIGVDAAAAGEILSQAGFTFQWKPARHPHERDDTAWGIPVQLR